MEYVFDILLYLLTFISSSLFIYAGLSRPKDKKKVRFLFLSLGILIPSLIAGVRYGVGADFFPYLGMYNNAARGQQIYYRSIEPLSTLLIVLSGKIGSSFFMFFAFNFITNLCIFLAFNRIFKGDSKKTTLTFFFYLCILFSTTLNAVRSGTAIALVSLAYSFLLSEWSPKSLLKSLVFILLGFLFHRSALLALFFIPVFWMAKKHSGFRLSVKKIMFLALYMATALLTPFLYSIFKNILPLGDYERYLNGFGSEFSIPLADILMIIPLLYSMLYLQKNKNSQIDCNFKELFYCSIFYFPLIIFVGWLTYADGLSRLSFMLEPLIMCLMAYLMSFSKNMINFWKIITIICITAITGLMFIRNLNWSKALPYKTVFHEEISYVSKN